MPDEDVTEMFRRMRHVLRDSDIEEIVRWQMTGAIAKKTPVVRRQPQPKCRHCGDDWHGLPQKGCPGSHLESLDDTPGTSKTTITDK